MKHTHATRLLFVVFFCAAGLMAQVSGSGTVNEIPLWKASTTLGNSRIFQSPTNVCTGSTCGMGIGTSKPTAHLHVYTNQHGRAAMVKVENAGPFSAAILELKAASSDHLDDWLFVAQDTGAGTTEGFRLENASAGVAMEVAPNLNIGIGTQTPTTRLHVAGGDVQTSDAGAGLIVKSPNGGVCARIGIDNSGAIAATPVICP